MLIHELVQPTGVPAKTIRYNEDIAPLPPPARKLNNYREYREDTEERLRFFTSARSLGFSLDIIAKILAVCNAGIAPCEHVLTSLKEQLVDIDRRITGMLSLQDTLMQFYQSEATLPRKDVAAEHCVCALVKLYAKESQSQRSMDMEHMPFEVLAKTIVQKFGPRDGSVRHAIVRELAHGQPVALTRLAATLQRSPDEVQAALQCTPDIEFDTDGNIIGWGLTLVPTPHRVQLDGREMYTWCALDALFYPILLEQPLQVQSACPVSGTLITLTASPEGVTDMSPATAVVSVIQPMQGDTCSCNRTTFCRQVHFFRSSADAARWHQAHPEARILSVGEAYKLGQVLARYWVKDVPAS